MSRVGTYHNLKGTHNSKSFNLVIQFVGTYHNLKGTHNTIT